jgi:Na+-driven multidrug efflux pump
MASPVWIEKLRARWKVNSIWQVIIILIVFACTGFTILFLKKPVLHFLLPDQGDDTERLTASILYYILIIPIYNVVLLGYGFVFGQFKFFWEFEKRMFSRIFKSAKKNP